MADHEGIVETRWLQWRGLNIRFLQSEGGSRTILCWPGLGLPAEEFLELLRRGPSHGYSVIALDPPGHGGSDPWPSGWSWPLAADLANEIATADHGRQMLLVGHSAGATTLLMCQSMLRISVCGLVLADGGLLWPDLDGRTAQQVRQANDAWFEQQRFQTWSDALAAAEAEIGSLTADQTAVLQQFYTLRQGLVVARADQETIAQVSILLATYFEHDVPLVLVPTLFLSGGRAGHPPDLSRLVGRVSDLRFELVPGASHELFLQGAQPVTSRILAFAQSLAGWSQSPPRPPVSEALCQ